MPQYLVTNYLPDNFDPSTMDEATVRAINELNEELIAAGARLLAAGLAPARGRLLDLGCRRPGRGARMGPQGCRRLPDSGRGTPIF